MDLAALTCSDSENEHRTKRSSPRRPRSMLRSPSSTPDATSPPPGLSPAALPPARCGRRQCARSVTLPDRPSRACGRPAPRRRAPSGRRRRGSTACACSRGNALVNRGKPATSLELLEHDAAQRLLGRVVGGPLCRLRVHRHRAPADLLGTPAAGLQSHRAAPRPGWADRAQVARAGAGDVPQARQGAAQWADARRPEASNPPGAGAWHAGPRARYAATSSSRAASAFTRLACAKVWICGTSCTRPCTPSSPRRRRRA